MENLLASSEVLERAGVSFYPTDRGGDVTYHGPGQLVGYPIMDLREWRRDVGAYVRGVEQVLIDTLAEYGIEAGRIPKLTGVWVGERKVAAIGVHISRWVTSHGFALNVSTDLSYFQYIVPCGLSKPVTSMAQLGAPATLDEVSRKLTVNFGRVFECEMLLEDPVLAAPERKN
jgi:lipoyl(octanoyl) transferase